MNDLADDPLAEFRKVNTDTAGTLNLARQAIESEVKRLVYISSVKVNGERTRERDERPASNTRLPCITNDGGMIIVTGPRHKGYSTKTTQRHCGQVERPTSDEKQKGQRSPRLNFPRGALFNWVKRSGARGQEKTEVRGQEKTEDRDQKSDVRGQGSVSKQFFSEGDVPEPADPYAVSKLEAEQGLMAIAEETGIEVVIIRPPLVYRPGVRANFLCFVKLVKLGIPLPFGRVKNLRSLICLGNLVDATVACMTNPNAAGKTYLASDGED